MFGTEALRLKGRGSRNQAMRQYKSATPWENLFWGICDQVRHKPASTVTEANKSLEILDF